MPMFYKNKIEGSFFPINNPILGRTLPSLLDEACSNHPSSQALNQWQAHTWQPQSNRELQTAAEELALGLLVDQLEPGDKVAFLMHSDLNFCLADFGSLLAGLVNVPIDLTQTLDNIIFILHHSAAKVLIVSDLDLLAQVIPYFENTPNLQTVIVANIPDDWEEKRTQLLACGLELGVNIAKEKDWDSTNLKQETTNYELRTKNSSSACLCIPMLLCQGRQELSCPELPQCIQLLSLDEVRARGKELRNEERRQELREKISPQDLATIVYIAGETGQPKGVMLTHENISSDILTTFKSIRNLQSGSEEIVLSFLPLTHIFARALLYGHLNYGHSIYFSTPNRAVRDFRTVRPTIVATVPRLLEKIYQKILDRGSKLQGIKKTIFIWALQLAQSYELGQPTGLLDALQFKLADWLVFSHWQKPFGGRLKYFISGGAALRADLANILSAARMTVLQGYGLTETSSVICCNRDDLNRAGTVGLPIAGVKIAIADDGEILVKAPYVMQGYYKNPEATKSVIDEQGWLHTGDLGQFTPEGFLIITGSKKDLFKLSTGKYVIPQPLEERVKQSSLVEQAVVVGIQKKFCGMLIFPNLERLRERAKALNLYLPITKLLQQPEIIATYQTLVDDANKQLPSWSKVKGFKLINKDLSIRNGLLDSHLTDRVFSINRTKINEIFAAEIDSLYGEETLRLSSELVRENTHSPLLWNSELKLLLGKFATLKHSLKRLVRKISVKAKLSWKHLKNYIALSSVMPWKLEETADSEELESEITAETQTS